MDESDIVHPIIREFESFFYREGWRVHSSSEYGAGLIEHTRSKTFYVLTGSDSESKEISLKRVARTASRYSTFKGNKIGKLVYLAKTFQNKVIKEATERKEDNLVLIELGKTDDPDRKMKLHCLPKLRKNPLVKDLAGFTSKFINRVAKERQERLTKIKIRSALTEVLRPPPTKVAHKKPVKIFPKETAERIRLLAFSDWRVQDISDVLIFAQSLEEPVDLILYAGDDIGRFEEEGTNYFSELSKHTKLGKVLAVIGNDDTSEVRKILEAEGVHDLHVSSLVFKNFAFVGLEASTSGPAIVWHEEDDFAQHLQEQYVAVGGRRLIILSHTPAYGVLDRGIRFADLDETTHHIGSTALREFIERHDVDLAIHGHCHSHGGLSDTLGKTTIVNVSSHDSPGSKGNFAIIEIDKQGNVSIEWHDTLDLEVHGEASLRRLHGVGVIRESELKRIGVKTARQLADFKDLSRLVAKSIFSNRFLTKLQLEARSLLDGKIYQIDPLDLPKGHLIFFDIETDIDRKRVWLIGVLSDNNFSTLYADNWEQEKNVLANFLALLKDLPKSTLVSFSGTNFDKNVVQRALSRHGFDSNLFEQYPHVDLCQLLRRSFIFPTQSFALKDLGKFLGYPFQHPDLDGFLVALEYHRHVEDGEPLDAKVLEYNRDDVNVLPFIIDHLSRTRPDVEPALLDQLCRGDDRSISVPVSRQPRRKRGHPRHDTMLVVTKTRVKKKTYERFLINIPAALVRDSQFPFAPGDLLLIRVDPRKKTILLKQA